MCSSDLFSTSTFIFQLYFTKTTVFKKFGVFFVLFFVLFLVLFFGLCFVFVVLGVFLFLFLFLLGFFFCLSSCFFGFFWGGSEERRVGKEWRVGWSGCQ